MAKFQCRIQPQTLSEWVYCYRFGIPEKDSFRKLKVKARERKNEPEQSVTALPI